ncbi:MAG: hypothetical protein AAB920_00925, partial [Patescibacteria group bacterium]
RERGIEAIKQVLHDKFVIKPEDIPEAYFDTQRRIAREQGHGDIEITEEMRERLSEVVVADQKSSLDTWVNYLSSPDAPYPDWLKYWATRSVLTMGEFDKEKKQFTKRSKGTTKPFPDLNREALAYALDVIEKKYKGEHINIDAVEAEDKEKFTKLLEGENFPKLYAFAIESVTPASKERLMSTEGKWVKYDKGTDHMPLVESLQGYGTGWCTAGESTAKTQLEGGDFYVFYSMDEEGNPTIPRAAIRMQEDKIGEVRGVAKDQNLDPYIGGVVQEKMKKFPDGAQYEKKAKDMKALTAIEHKSKAGEKLTKDELAFLYELDTPIDGFGYERDPRIEELRSQRNSEEDMPIVFECTKDQIAHTPDEVNEHTIAYVGTWNIDVFNKIKNYPTITHLYESFPDKKIFMRTLETDPSIQTPEQAEARLKEKSIYLSDWGKDILYKTEFSKNQVRYELVEFTVKQLSLSSSATMDEIYKKAEELGLELCSSEVGPQLRLSYSGRGWLLIAMKQITDRDGYPSVFSLNSDGAELSLNAYGAGPWGRWNADRELVFLRSRKPA